MWVNCTSLHKVDDDEGYRCNLLFKMEETLPNVDEENCPLVDKSSNERVMLHNHNNAQCKMKQE